MLYDLKADPYELKKLATEPGLAGLKACLRERLKQCRVQQGGDLGRVPGSEDARFGSLRYAR
jgi:hypothetical protein